jgi:hypothetical protein
LPERKYFIYEYLQSSVSIKQMGNNASTTASNIAKLSANTNVSTQASCNNSQIVTAKPTTITVGEVDCANLNIGNTTVTSKATCEQYSSIAIIAKAIADQSAKTDSSTGIGIFDQAKANASNYVEVQNNLEAIIASSCTNSQKINLETRSFTAGIIRGDQCNIFNETISQEAACIQTILADITNTTETNQEATASASAGLNLQHLIIVIALVLAGMCLFTLCAAVLRSMFRGGSSSDILKSESGLFNSGGSSIADLRAKATSLERALKAREAAQQAYLNRLQSIQTLK